MQKFGPKIFLKSKCARAFLICLFLFDVSISLHYLFLDNEESINTNVKEQQARDSLIKEGSVMSLIRHPNIIKVFLLPHPRCTNTAF